MVHLVIELSVEVGIKVDEPSELLRRRPIGPERRRELRVVSVELEHVSVEVHAVETRVTRTRVAHTLPRGGRLVRLGLRLRLRVRARVRGPGQRQG